MARTHSQLTLRFDSPSTPLFGFSTLGSARVSVRGEDRVHAPAADGPIFVRRGIAPGSTLRCASCSTVRNTLPFPQGTGFLRLALSTHLGVYLSSSRVVRHVWRHQVVPPFWVHGGDWYGPASVSLKADLFAELRGCPLAACSSATHVATGSTAGAKRRLFSDVWYSERSRSRSSPDAVCSSSVRHPGAVVCRCGESGSTTYPRPRAVWAVG